MKIFGIMGLLLLILVYVSLYAYSAQSLEAVDLDFELREVTDEGFSLVGDVSVLNNGLVPVGIDHVTYTLTLDEELASGDVLIDSWVWPGETEEYVVTMDVYWAPAAEVAMNLLNPEGTFVTVSGNIYLVGSVSVPYSTRIDIGPFLRQYITEAITDGIDSIVDTFKGLFG